MFINIKLFAIGLHLSTWFYSLNSFVLLTANIDDLKRIANKFVSNSLADKIAEFIIEAADKDTDSITENNDNSNDIINLSEHLKEFKAESRQKINNDVEKRGKQGNISNKPTKLNEHRSSEQRKRKQIINNKNGLNINKVKKTAIKNQSSLEYYKSIDGTVKRKPKVLDDIDMLETEDSLTVETRKDFHKIKSYEVSMEDGNEKSDFEYEKLQKSVENNISRSKASVTDHSEDNSDDVDYSNRVDMKSREKSSNFDVTTEKHRTEFDQYINTYYPKAKVLATSGFVELPKLSTGIDLSDTDFD